MADYNNQAIVFGTAYNSGEVIPVAGATSEYVSIGDNSYISCYLSSDQDGDVFVDISFDGTTWFQLDTQAVTGGTFWANTYQYLIEFVRLRFVPAVQANVVGIVWSKST